MLRVYGAHVRAVEQAGVRKPKQTQRGHAVCRDALRKSRSKTLSRLQQSINTADCRELLLIGRHNGNVLDDQNQNCGGVVQFVYRAVAGGVPIVAPDREVVVRIRKLHGARRIAEVAATGRHNNGD